MDILTLLTRLLRPSGTGWIAMPLAVCWLAGCAARETPVEIGDREQILHLGNLSEPKDLDPHVVTGVTEHNIIAALLEGLVAEDPRDLHPVPGMAERWDVSPDGTVYTFHLRDSARWSNGDPVTAHDFVFSYRRILTPGLGSPYAYMLFALRNAEAYYKGETTDFSTVGVGALDNHTLRLELATPVPYFLSLLNHFSWLPVHGKTILAHGPIDAIGSQWTRPGNYVGNGPFTLEAWEPGKKIVVVKNPLYWDACSVGLQKIVFHPIGDHRIEENAFRAGQLHVTGTVPLDRIEHHRRTHPDRLRLDPYLGSYYYLFNTQRPPLDQPEVRRALSLAIDRQAIVDYVTRGGEAPALHFTPPGTAGYNPGPLFQPGLEQARHLLAKAGFPDGKGFPELELLYNTSDAHARIAQAVQQMWRQNLQIDIKLVNMEWKVYLEQTRQGRFDIARAGWIGDYVDPNTFLDLWITGGGNNRAGWASPAYDTLIARAAATRDPSARLEIFKEAESLLMQAMPIMPIYFYRSKSLIQPSVRGWHPTLLDHHPYKHIHLVSTE
jgi:oligopeptide transport system substrate-binding protein